MLVSLTILKTALSRSLYSPTSICSIRFKVSSLMISSAALNCCSSKRSNSRESFSWYSEYFFSICFFYSSIELLSCMDRLSWVFSWSNSFYMFDSRVFRLLYSSITPSDSYLTLISSPHISRFFSCWASSWSWRVFISFWNSWFSLNRWELSCSLEAMDLSLSAMSATNLYLVANNSLNLSICYLSCSSVYFTIKFSFSLFLNDIYIYFWASLPLSFILSI